MAANQSYSELVLLDIQKCIGLEVRPCLLTTGAFSPLPHPGQVLNSPAAGGSCHGQV